MAVKIAKSKQMTKGEFCKEMAELYKERGLKAYEADLFLMLVGDAIQHLMSIKNGPQQISLGFLKLRKVHVKARTYYPPGKPRGVKRAARKSVRASVMPSIRNAARG